MAFPLTALPVTVEIAPGADPAGDTAAWSWVDITSSVRYSTDLGRYIRIEHGAPPEATRVDPSRCTMWLDNRTGDFTPRNPNGQYYGSLGRNTPLRVSIRRADDDFTRTESSGWGAEPTWGDTWTVSGGSASDYSVSGGTGRQSLGSVGTLRHSLLDIGQTDARVTVDVTCPVVPTGATISHWVLGRVTDINNYYVALINIATSGAATLGILKRVSGTLTTVVSAVSVGTHSAGNTWRVLFDYQGSTLRAKAWKTSGSEPTSWQVEGTDTDLTTGTQIGLAAREETGNTNGTQVIQWDNLTAVVDRFSGFVSSWPPRWDKSGNDATVPIEANGVLRRLGQGSPPSYSPMRRSVMSAASTGLLAYWPCEDLEHSTQAASAIGGQRAMTVSGTVEFASVDPNDGVPAPYRIATAPLPQLNGGGSLRGDVPAGSSSPVEWAVAFAANADTSGAGTSIVLAQWETPTGSHVRWAVQQTQPAGTTDVIVYNSAGTATTIISDSGWTTARPDLHRVDAIQNGANIDVRLWTGGQLEASVSVAGTLGRVTSVTANPDSVTSANTIGIGHVMVWDDKDAPALETHLTTVEQMATSAWHSYWNESFDDRLSRVCEEAGVSLSMPTVSADFAVTMGAQPTAAFLDLPFQCADGDQGVLYESGFGLGYIPREQRYNRSVAMTLDFDSGQIADPPEPADDDQQLRNRVEVKRTIGSSAVAEDADSIATHGTYDDEVTVNHATDTGLPDHAAWQVHLGTTDVMRWPRIDINLAASPELVDDWLSCGIQSRVQANNPPDEVAGDDIDVIIEGWSETLGYKDWYVTLNCSPAQPWTVATADGEPRVDTDGATLTSSVTSSATSFQMTSTGTVWTTDPSDTPFDINVSGERMRVDAVGTLINSNPFFDTDTTGWSAQSSTIARSTAVVHDDGTASLLITPDGSASSGGVQADLSAVGTVTAGASYIACLWAYSPGGWSDLRACVDWYDSAGAFLSTGLGSASSVTAGEWTFLKQTLTAPASASRARVRVRHGSTPAAGDIWYVWGVRLISAASTTSPQTFAVSRSRNGIVKAHDAGTAVNVWSPAYVAL